MLQVDALTSATAKKRPNEKVPPSPSRDQGDAKKPNTQQQATSAGLAAEANCDEV